MDNLEKNTSPQEEQDVNLVEENVEEVSDLTIDDLDDNLANLNWYGRTKLKIKMKLQGDKPVTRKRHKMVSYSKYGYIFLIPFFLIFALFSLYPLFQTIYYSFFEYYFARGG